MVLMIGRFLLGGCMRGRLGMGLLTGLGWVKTGDTIVGNNGQKLGG